MSPLSIREVYRALDIAGADSDERDETLRSLVNGEEMPETLVAHPSIVRFQHQIDECWYHVGRLLRHAQRTTHPRLRSYMEAVRTLHEAIQSRCNYRLCTTLQKHAAYCETIFTDLQRGQYDDSFARVVRNRLVEDLAKDAEELVKQIGKIDTEPDGAFQRAEPEEEVEHDKFVKALEKKYKLSVHRWEPVREGLLIYIDEENTKLLAQAFDGDGQIPSDEFNEFLDDRGYLLLRRGVQKDITFGGFPVACSRWIFVHAPSECDNWIGSDCTHKLDKERRAEVIKTDKRMTKELEKTRLSGKVKGGDIKTAKTLGGKKKTLPYGPGKLRHASELQALGRREARRGGKRK